MLTFHFYTTAKYQRTKDFLTFPLAHKNETLMQNSLRWIFLSSKSQSTDLHRTAIGWFLCNRNIYLAQEMKFSIEDFFNKCDQICKFLNPIGWHFTKCEGLFLRKSWLLWHALQRLNKQLHNLKNLKSTWNSTSFIMFLWC